MGRDIRLVMVPAPFLSRAVALLFDLWILQILVSVVQMAFGAVWRDNYLQPNLKSAIILLLLLIFRLVGEYTGKNLSTKRFFAVSVSIPGEGIRRIVNILIRNSWIIIGIAINLLAPESAGSEMFIALLVALTSLGDLEKRTITDRWAGAKLLAKDS